MSRRITTSCKLCKAEIYFIDKIAMDADNDEPHVHSKSEWYHYYNKPKKEEFRKPRLEVEEDDGCLPTEEKEPEPTNKEEPKGLTKPFPLPTTGSIRVARSKNYQTIEFTFEVEEMDMISAARDTYRRLGQLLDEESD